MVALTLTDKGRFLLIRGLEGHPGGRAPDRAASTDDGELLTGLETLFIE
jgi:hypothetical protein